MTSTDTHATGEDQRSAVRSMRVSGIPAPPPRARKATQTAADSKSEDHDATAADGEKLQTSTVEIQPVADPAATPANGAGLLNSGEPDLTEAFRYLIRAPREAARVYKDAHESAGVKTDTFALPLDLFAQMNRVCKERNATKRWLVAAALAALFDAMEAHPTADDD